MFSLPTSPLRRQGARLLFAALMAATLAACGESTEVPSEPAKPTEPTDPARSCSVKTPNNRCAP